MSGWLHRSGRVHGEMVQAAWTHVRVPVRPVTSAVFSAWRRGSSYQAPIFAILEVNFLGTVLRPPEAPARSALSKTGGFG